MNRKLTGLMLSLALLAGCGEAGSPSGAAPTAAPTAAPAAASASYDTDAKAIVLEKTQGGGFVTPMWRRLEELPHVRLYGDGRMIYRAFDAEGKMSWMELKLAPIEMEALLKDILGPNKELCDAAEIPSPPVSDVPATVLTVQLNDLKCQATVPALGMEGTREGITPAGVTLLKQAEHADKALETIQTQTAKPFVPDSVILAAEPSQEHEMTVEWPVKSVAIKDGATVSGPDAAAVLQAAAMPFSAKSADGTYEVVALPVLP